MFENLCPGFQALTDDVLGLDGENSTTLQDRRTMRGFTGARVTSPSQAWSSSTRGRVTSHVILHPNLRFTGHQVGKYSARGSGARYARRSEKDKRATGLAGEAMVRDH